MKTKLKSISKQKLSHLKWINNLGYEIILTYREYQVLSLIIQEKTSIQIAEVLNISSRTIETHRKNLLAKTKSINSVGLVLFCFNNKLVTQTKLF